MCGRAVERLPQLARRIVEAGHEAACHGWLWRPHADYADRADELHDLRRCVEVMEKATGQRPTGFFCRGSESRETRSILRELGFGYASNGFDDDLPYWDRSDTQRPLLVLPYALDSNDMKFFHPNGFVRADEMVDYVRDAIEMLLEEGEAGHPKLLNIGWHLRIAGRPGRFAAFKRVLALLEFLRREGVDRAARRDRGVVAGTISGMRDLPMVGMPLAFVACGRRHICRM